MGLAENIKALIIREGISQNTFASMVEVSAPTVSRWLSGSMDIRPSSIRRICDAFGVTPDDLRSESHGLAARLSQGQGRYYAGEGPTIPLIPASAAGEWELLLDDGSIEHVEIPYFVAKAHPKAFAVTVPDSAMDRIIPCGAHAVIDPSCEPSNAAIVAVELEEGSFTLRRWLKGNQTVMLSTEAVETDTKEDLLLATDDLELNIVGTVVWFQPTRMLA